MVTNPFRAERMWKQIGVSEPKQHSLNALLSVILWWTASVSGGLLSDCKFPDCTAGRGRLRTGRASAPACSGSGKEEGLISLHPEGGSHVHVPCECVCVWTHRGAECTALCSKVCAVCSKTLRQRSIEMLLETRWRLYFLDIFILSLGIKTLIKSDRQSVCSWLFSMYILINSVDRFLLCAGRLIVAPRGLPAPAGTAVHQLSLVLWMHRRSL